MKKLFLSLCFLLGCTLGTVARDLPAIIPAPLTMTEGQGSFSLNDQTKVVCTASARPTPSYGLKWYAGRPDCPCPSK